MPKQLNTRGGSHEQHVSRWAEPQEYIERLLFRFI
jgi:hypothetical protein